MRAVNEIRLIDPETYPADRAQWLWEQVRTQETCFDDFYCDESGPRPDLFAERMMSPSTVALEVGDVALIVIDNIVPRAGANIHFFCWGEISDEEMCSAGSEVIHYVMGAWLLRRLTATPPEYNRLAKRLALALGFQFEGCLRDAFRKRGRYWNLHVYGLVKEN